MIGLILLGSPSAFCAEVTILSGGLKDAQGDNQWEARFWVFHGDQMTITPARGANISTTREQHAEAQCKGALGADFLYEADVKIDAAAEPHLQFRISDEGRYGLRLRTTGIALYRFRLEPRKCSEKPAVIAHCPLWQFPDPPIFNVIKEKLFNPKLPSGSVHRMAVRARGDAFDVMLDGNTIFSATDPSFGVGRFGVYAIGAPDQLTRADGRSFSNLRATTDPTLPSNFALLYSTVGYEARGTKRALVRTLNDLPSGSFDPSRSRFVVTKSDGSIAKTGALTPLPGKTFGMQLWEADFSTVVSEGSYTIQVDFALPGELLQLRSSPLEVRSKLVSTRLLKPMSLANAEARRAADEDFWRNWIQDSGVWRVGIDGAFIADRADAQAGSTITRVFNTNNESLATIVDRDRKENRDRTGDCRFVGRMTIVSGCDAQMRFQDVSGDWWAVTLQAGAAGGCPDGSGPGAVRLSREGASGFVPLASTLFPTDHPFQTGHPYDVEILVHGSVVQVFVDREQGAVSEPLLQFFPVSPRSGLFGLKAWGATVRFEDVQAWKSTVQFKPLPPGSTRIPTFLNNDHNVVAQVPCQYAPRFCPDKQCRKPLDSAEEQAACNPLFSQLHGFHDSSSQVAEATSHGAFLSGLMAIWRSRAATFTQDERESLRRAIVANALYLNTLFEEGGEGVPTGQFAHSEMGRVEVNINGIWNTEAALYGESDFAADGAFVDRALARKACSNAVAAAAWRWPDSNPADYPFLASIVFSRLARCTARESAFDRSLLLRSAVFAQLAADAAEHVLNRLEDPASIRKEIRDTGRIVPWLEGVYEVVRSNPDKRDVYLPRLEQIASNLVEHLTQEHLCDETLAGGPRCPANGFHVLPQASGDEVVAIRNWVDMQSVPSAKRSTEKLSFVHWYNVQGHFPTSATDAVLLARMTGNANLERIATGNLYWSLGLNPGIPTSKVVRANGSGSAWQTSSFIRGLDAAFARAHDGFRIESYAAKGWLDF